MHDRPPSAALRDVQMTLRIVKITQSRFGCSFRFPVMSTGGVILKETPCLLSRGHDGPHRGPDGAMAVNDLDVRKMLGG